MADYQYLNDTGVIVPDTAEIQAGVEAEYQAAFGEELTVNPETPQGILIAAEVLARSEVVENNAAVANQINPNIAGGVFLQAICALTGLEPPVATFSLVQGVTLTGVASTVVPAGSIAKTDAGDQFQLISEVTLDSDGSGTGDFQALTAGPVPCAIGELDSIVTEVLGWETVTNAAAAILGEDSPSDEALRQLRQNTLALQGSSLVEAITSALYDVPGVKSLAFRENIAATSQTIDGILMVAHSIWACVQGGTDEDVATALLATKTMGANWNGAVEVEVTEPASGQDYTVKFDRPDEVTIYAEVRVKAGTATGDVQTLVRDALIAYAAGEVDGYAGFVVGAPVSPFEMAAAIAAQIPGIFITKVGVNDTSSSDPYDPTELALDLDQLATLIAGNIAVVIV